MALRALILGLSIGIFLVANSRADSLKFADLVEHSSEFSQALMSGAKDYLLVQFWSPYCLPCGDEVAEINKVVREFAGSQVHFAALGVPIEKRKGEVSAFLSHFGPQYPQWNADQDFLKRVISREISLPWDILLNKDLKIVREWKGKVSAREIESVVRGGIK